MALKLTRSVTTIDFDDLIMKVVELFAASDEARVPDAVAIQMAEIFAADIDMHRELRRGDTFSVVYESMTADGEPIGWGQSSGRVLAAEFVNGGKTHQAAWYRGADGRGAVHGDVLQRDIEDFAGRGIAQRRQQHDITARQLLVYAIGVDAPHFASVLKVHTIDHADRFGGHKVARAHAHARALHG